ncbi:MAG: AAA family ATPase, partial [Planctomycetota bacterium]
MRINVPIYITHRRGRGSRPPVTAQPLFETTPVVSGSHLGDVLSKLSQKLRVRLGDLAKTENHRELLTWHNETSIESTLIKCRLDLGDRSAHLKLVLAALRRYERKLAFSPSLPDVWFDVEPGESLLERATEVYQSHFRSIGKDFPDYPVESHCIEGRGWIDEVSIEVMPSFKTKKQVDPLRALLGGEDVSDGGEQLRKTGRCLNWGDEQDLVDPIGVDGDIQRLVQLLQAGDRRGVVLIGPSGSGKTARIEGAVKRRMARARSSLRGCVWHLSPARLISGMSFLGQWQQRVLSILRYAYRQDHVLYFDDLLGLYEAGRTRDSAMCVADTLRSQIDSRPVRLLAEMTPEAWSVLRERDRTFADRFVVMPVQAMDRAASLPVLIGVMRRLESRRKCRFDLDVMPEVLSLYDRFESVSVLPGKAAAALDRMAATHATQVITREDAIKEFKSRSGLQEAIIDNRRTISREEILSRVRQHVVGQDAAVDVLVDRVLVAAARMNDSTRPLAAYLLVGPTGVGKTQLAKAIAECLFDEGGMIRLDMNELSSPTSAARLVGTFDNPDGLLTSAIRRRPHAVLLLDEIEKAHPSVLDALLHALGEARLSDARGRVVDLSGLLILMTSNLGARESSRRSGFADSDADEATRQAHLRAVREFFRPEFFNRIDDVLCFDRLSPESIESIAEIQLRQVLRRDGLLRRRVLFDVDPSAIRLTALAGYDPKFGARALKRRIEQDLVRPAAEVLASTASTKPTLLRLDVEDGKLRTRLDLIDSESDTAEAGLSTQAQPIVSGWGSSVESWLGRVHELVADTPLRFEVGDEGVDSATLELMALKESLREADELFQAYREATRQPAMQRKHATPVKASHLSLNVDFHSRSEHRDLQAIDDIHDFIRESTQTITADQVDHSRRDLVVALDRLWKQLACRTTTDRAALRIRIFGDSLAERLAARVSTVGSLNRLTEALRYWLVEQEQLDVSVWHADDQQEVDDGERIERRGESVLICSGAFCLASLSELLGSWWIQSKFDSALAEIRVLALPPEGSQPASPDGSYDLRRQIAQWTESLVNRTILP